MAHAAGTRVVITITDKHNPHSPVTVVRGYVSDPVNIIAICDDQHPVWHGCELRYSLAMGITFGIDRVCEADERPRIAARVADYRTRVEGEMMKARKRSSRVSHTKQVDRPSWNQWTGRSGVYAIAAYGCCAVKVGYSSEIGTRLRGLSTAMPFRLEVVGWIPGGEVADEQLVHKQLKNWHLRGEWFAWCDEVKSHIEKNFTAPDGDTALTSELQDREVASWPLLELAAKNDAEVAIAGAFARMGPREREVLSAWTGGLSTRPMTIEEFCNLAYGETHGMSAERMRQIIAKFSFRLCQSSVDFHDESTGDLAIQLSDELLNLRDMLPLDIEKCGIGDYGGVIVFRQREGVA